ncbi:MAG: hypothetical protein WC180_06245 [Candidatus Paceibacterota bacterium]
MKLTKEETVKLHRELWGWLAENPMKHKADWPGFKDKGHIINRCFCCEFTADIKREIDCIKCPLVWPGGGCGSSLFGEWEPAKLPEERSRLAALIRDLPIKEYEKPAPKFAVGDKVVPVSKSVGDSFEAWTRHRKRDYVTVQQLPPNKFGNFYICNSDYFLESDLTPYIEESKPEPAKEEPKPAFNIGDRVRVKKDLIVGHKYGDLHLHAGQMADERGREGIVNSVRSHSLSISGSWFSWDFGMIELIPIPSNNQAPENKTETMLSITFTFKGSQTICRIEESGRKFKGSAKCNPGDEWNEQIGKDLSMARAEIKRANHDIRQAIGHN